MAKKSSDYTFKRGIGLAALVAFGIFSQACRSKLDVKSKDGPVPAIEAPPEVLAPVDQAEQPTVDPVDQAPPVAVEKKDALAMKGGKLYFQTRDTITIEIKKAVIEGAPSFSLLNITKSGKDDTKAVKIVQEDVGHFGLHDGFALADYSAESAQLQFYPGEALWKDKFFYGKNILKIVANDEDNPRYSTIELYLQDFDVFGVAMTSFATNVQVAKLGGPQGYQFQGWVNVLSPPTVATADKKSVLTNGMFNMVNPQ